LPVARDETVRFGLSLPAGLSGFDSLSRLLKNSMIAGRTRQNPTNKRSRRSADGHFEEGPIAAGEAGAVRHAVVEALYLAALCSG